jgi:hypothetical protein
VVPQQSTAPPERTAHAKRLPTATAVAWLSPVTSTGFDESPSVVVATPLPSSPSSLSPQHSTVPPGTSAQVSLPRAAIAATCAAHAPDAQANPVPHAFPHAPQLLPSVCSLTQVDPHSVYPLLQTHPPHAQVLLQVSVPFPLQVWVAVGEHAPCPEHVDEDDQEPSLLQVPVSVPQLPHGCVAGPLQGQTAPWQVTPLAQA